MGPDRVTVILKLGRVRHPLHEEPQASEQRAGLQGANGRSLGRDIHNTETVAGAHYEARTHGPCFQHCPRTSPTARTAASCTLFSPLYDNCGMARSESKLLTMSTHSSNSHWRPQPGHSTGRSLRRPETRTFQHMAAHNQGGSACHASRMRLAPLSCMSGQ